MNMLTLVTFAPLLGALIILCLPKEKIKAIQTVAFVFAGISFVASLAMIPGFNQATHEMQFVER
ncbi:MAG: NADH-quinone oxidoreductase subunit M, partial [Elusimicrobiota bacterium]|nr:NADH-quinone oxidoreductase subunit M [Elusimicrobiota bacterium]